MLMQIQDGVVLALKRSQILAPKVQNRIPPNVMYSYELLRFFQCDTECEP